MSGTFWSVLLAVVCTSMVTWASPAQMRPASAEKACVPSAHVYGTFDGNYGTTRCSICLAAVPGCKVSASANSNGAAAGAHCSPEDGNCGVKEPDGKQFGDSDVVCRLLHRRRRYMHRYGLQLVRNEMQIVPAKATTANKHVNARNVVHTP